MTEFPDLPELPDGCEWLQVAVAVNIDALRADPEGAAERVAIDAAESARRTVLERGRA